MARLKKLRDFVKVGLGYSLQKVAGFCEAGFGLLLAKKMPLSRILNSSPIQPPVPHALTPNPLSLSGDWGVNLLYTEVKGWGEGIHNFLRLRVIARLMTSTR